MSEAYIVDACRTPRGIGKQGKGALAHLHPQDLGATVLRALRDRNALETARVDDIIWSTSQQRGKQAGCLGRLSALWAGYDVKASGMTLDRFCGGGITSVGLAAGQIMAGFEDVIIAGGTEMMSHHAELDSWEVGTPFQPLGRARGNYDFYEEHPISNVGVAADAIAAMEGISRSDLEALGVESQRKAKIAMEEGRFAKSVVPVFNRDGSLTIYIQSASPGKDKETNWLPSASSGPFALTFRTYLPGPDIVAQTWFPPPVVRLSLGSK